MYRREGGRNREGRDTNSYMYMYILNMYTYIVHVHVYCNSVLKSGHPSVVFILCLFVLYRCGMLGLGFLPFFPSSDYMHLSYQYVYVLCICIHVV